MNLEKELFESLTTSYIDDKHLSLEEYRTKLLINNQDENIKVLTTLIKELKSCKEFFFCVAFITNSGISTLINILKDLQLRNIKGKIITSAYLNFTEPSALERLLQFKNIELRINKADQRSHSKGYIFKKESESVMIVGSSNLTASALCENKEWNIKITSGKDGNIYKQMIKEFENDFENATIVTQKWLEEYKTIYNQNTKLKKQVMLLNNVSTAIVPNSMQQKALQSLNEIRCNNKNKALLISATGTGKTYLCAFDVKNVNPTKFLFIVHRENIAQKAMDSFNKVFNNTKKMGMLTGNIKQRNSDYIFATIQTLSKDDVLYSFDKEEFDYIVIDEVHHSTSPTYKKIIKYFNPKFLLGMSATPERSDGDDIYGLFDNNIAYELRLNEALKNKLVVPFHYYGIADIKVNGELINEDENFNFLVDDERVKKIIEASKFYGYSGDRLRALVFCSRVEETKILSQKFNELGYHTIALNGENSEEERQRAIDLLESKTGDYLEYIFTVDIFNEGIDITSVNQVIALRPTNSSVIFVQQLGRGLRISEDKEYLVVIDFIGNYSNNYLLPIALFGDTTYNKDNLRKFMISSNRYISGSSTISFEKIVEQKIFESINKKNFLEKSKLINEYIQLKYKIGKIPKMMDFINYGNRDPIAYSDYKKTSYMDFVSKLEATNMQIFTPEQMNYIDFLTKEVVTTKKIEEILILESILKYGSTKITLLKQEINKKYGYIPSDKYIDLSIRNINGEFLKKSDRKKYVLYNSIRITGNLLIPDKKLLDLLKNEEYKDWVIDVINYGKYIFNNMYIEKNFEDGFLLYEKYNRRQILRILDFKNDIPALDIGGYLYNDRSNSFPLFVTYEKNNYDNEFIGNNIFTFMSKPNRTMNSSEIIRLKEAKKNNMRIPLFMKKSTSEGNDFYYLGNVEPLNFESISIKNFKQKDNSVIKITFKLVKPVEDNIFDYLNS